MGWLGGRYHRGAAERVIRVSVAVSSGAVRFKVEVQAESIERAVRLACVRYPGCEVRVLFPINPEVYFAPPKRKSEVRIHV